MTNQMALPLETGGARPRVRLLDAPSEDGLGLVWDAEAIIGYSRWETQVAPPCDGWWDVTDSRTGTMQERWWFCGSKGPRAWCPASHPPQHGDDLVMHDEFVERFLAWRGLRAPHPDVVYPTPPYDVEVLMTLAKAAGVTLHTKYATYTRPPVDAVGPGMLTPDARPRNRL